jgi:hypothetical protein
VAPRVNHRVAGRPGPGRSSWSRTIDGVLLDGRARPHHVKQPPSARVREAARDEPRGGASAGRERP